MPPKRWKSVTPYVWTAWPRSQRSVSHAAASDTPRLPLSCRMSEYVKKIAAEEFAAQVARVFSNSESPYGHVDAEQVSPGPHLPSLRSREPENQRPLKPFSLTPMLWTNPSPSARMAGRQRIPHCNPLRGR